MEYKIKEKTNTKIVFETRNDKDEIEEAKRKAYKELSKKVRVPGFRKGKAPYEIGAAYVGEGRLLEDAIDFLMRKDLEEVLEKEKVDPITRPDVKLEKIDENGLTLTFTVEFLPDVSVEVPEKIEVKFDKSGIDKEVEKKLKDLQNTFTEIKPVEREAKEGDLVEVQYKIQNVKNADWKTVSVEVGKKQFVGDFDEQIVGKKPGDEFEVKSENMTVSVKVVSVKEKNVPEIDDNLAKDAGFESLDDMKKSIEEEALKNRKLQLEEEKGNEALSILAENTEVELPEKFVNEETDSRIKDLENRYMKYGVRLEDILKSEGKTLDEFKKEVRETVVKDIKKDLILRDIIRKQNIKVTDDEIKEEFERFLESQNIDKKKARLSDEAKRVIEDQILRNKAISFLKERAIIKEGDD